MCYRIVISRSRRVPRRVSPPSTAGLSAPGPNVTYVIPNVAELITPAAAQAASGGTAERPPAPIITPGAPAGLIDALEFTVVDVETTGWEPGEARITEIGAVRVSRGRVLAHFSVLVNPGELIPAEISALTGITDAMARRAPAIGAVMPRFLEFAAGSILAAHHAAFDIGFLQAGAAACGAPWPDFAVLDTVPLARLVLAEGEVTDRKLGTLAAFFRARTRPCHRALPDAMATVEVLHGLLGRLALAGVRTLAELGQTPDAA
jgi:DNA polymerase III epsilon subunit family exonuclease